MTGKHAAAARPKELMEGRVYVAPSGRLCRWVPPRGGRGHAVTYAVFEYLDQPPPDARRHVEEARWRDGFWLSPASLRLLRVAPGVGA